ncbi:FtsB family cell division protein [Commensalibacter oyaizuii]|uniref:Septum formation initiator family protein n=1 Tax=Commensalibacter oyaizuii TaxID=3043873 RepID=A0ABT6PZI8_9PROT|nr:septum formation initiator family protein [Commensalibacter sp. TBRC 16381]MDI2090234.1 septum formation initiator family protein [Commensalibacter sp. TBRC 16381]
MGFFHVVKKVIKSVVPPVFFLGLTGYFLWNTLNGDHGLKSYYVQQKLLVEAQNAQQDAVSEQQAWGRRVVGLKEGALDKDLLDERARVMLSFAQDNEIVIPYKANDHLY